jgi:lipopolysaccharide export LptBFGC system permease protein LptF
LEVSWKAFWKDVTVTADGGVLGVIPNQKALTAGQEFHLPDGATLKVQLVNKVISVELQVLRNGQPLPGSASDPQTRLKTAYGVVYFVAGLNLVLGILSVLFSVQLLREMGIGFGSIIFGLVFLILGFFVQRKSNVALILAIVILILDALLGLYLSVSRGYTPSIGGILVRIVLIIPMIQGVGAINQLKRQSLP